MSKTFRKDYRPKNHSSKRYVHTDLNYWSDAYEAGDYCRGHKTRHADNQSINQQVRSKEKRQWKKQINLDI